ncbi:hypothetical protein [Lysinibacillus sp. JNUCC 51]|uniref:hypothetical protein n=1 Tax=Lysinibacillus sp. JNUCC-51 TaxID=2792479 RepID=UPI00193712A1|nr:hypothetical protein JNUCC51_02710 [Lysinibacillus sp. JNUCC-51]
MYELTLDEILERKRAMTLQESDHSKKKTPTYYASELTDSFMCESFFALWKVDVDKIQKLVVKTQKLGDKTKKLVVNTQKLIDKTKELGDKT